MPNDTRIVHVHSTARAARQAAALSAGLADAKGPFAALARESLRAMNEAAGNAALAVMGLTRDGFDAAKKANLLAGLVRESKRAASRQAREDAVSSAYRQAASLNAYGRTKPPGRDRNRVAKARVLAR